MGNPDEAASLNRHEAKRLLRREMFTGLRGMPDEEKSAASSRICGILAARPEFQKATVVAAFVSLASEPDLVALLETDLAAQKWCLPRVSDEGTIEMRRITGLDQLITGEFKIQEPDPNACPLVSESDIDLILLPGVGFDPAHRARLGRGKGHYDRFLERLRELKSPPPAWGVCFSRQLCSINPEPHDQPVDAIVTEIGFAV